MTSTVSGRVHVCSSNTPGQGLSFDPTFKVSHISTYDLYRCNAPHQLLKECGLAVRELPDAVPDELLLVLWEAVTISSFQQPGAEQQQQTQKQKLSKTESQELQVCSTPACE